MTRVTDQQSAVSIMRCNQDNDPIIGRKAKLQFEAASYTVNENDGTVNVELVRSGSNAGRATVAYNAVSGTAHEGSDYVEASGTVTFEDGETNKTIQVEIIDDKRMEPQKKFVLKLSNPSGASLGTMSATDIIIKDDDRIMRFPVPGTNELPNSY
ncbi:Calx-beta domain-containing protein [Paenibacillus sp. SI8]|uniref:Calx-beta domain-containing protein n=1 Tax=unclassified Paenibacillus TaxID=185978 RepID=UPI0034654C6E